MYPQGSSDAMPPSSSPMFVIPWHSVDTRDLSGTPRRMKSRAVEVELALWVALSEATQPLRSSDDRIDSCVVFRLRLTGTLTEG